MFENIDLCDKIQSIYPDLGACGTDLKVEFDAPESSWMVRIKRGNAEIKHRLPVEDADACMATGQCVALGIEVGQFRR